MRLDPEVFERHGSFGVMMQERNIEERAKYPFLPGQNVRQIGTQ